MNELNVKALTGLFLEAIESVPEQHRAGPVADGKRGPAAREDAEKWAMFLASRGVLVPSVLTEEQAADCAYLELDRMLRAVNLSHTLERIAKGGL